MTTVWGDDQRFVDTYFATFRDRVAYSTFDWATRDDDGYYFLLGRTDDVINVAGHRLGTREIEEAVQAHPGVAEVAVVGVVDSVKGQVPVAFVVVRNAGDILTPEGVARMRKEVLNVVDHELGAIGRPAQVHFVPILPKTRSGKLLRRSLQALAEGRDPGDLTTIEDPAALEHIRLLLGAPSA
jgi:propionyl-CoA synthetase